MRYVIILILTIIFLFIPKPEFLSDMDSFFWMRATAGQLFHANIFHLILNCMAVWNLFKVTPYRNARTIVTRSLIAFAIATLSYSVALRPVIGISNLLFAMIGMSTPALSHQWWKLRNTKVFLVVMVASLALPMLSATTHIFSFACGTLVAMVARQIDKLSNDVRRASI